MSARNASRVQRPTRIAFLAGAYVPQRDGVSVYIENLLIQLVARAQAADDGARPLQIEIFGCRAGIQVLRQFLPCPESDSGVSLKIHELDGDGAWTKYVVLPLAVLRAGPFDLSVLPNLQPLPVAGRKLSILHDLTYQVARDQFSRLRYLYMHALTRWRLASDDAMGVISQTTESHLQRYYPRSRNIRLLHLPNGLPQSKLGERPPAGLREQAVTDPELQLLFCGRLNRLKGVDRLLRVARVLDQACGRGELPPTTLHLVGKSTADTDALFAGERFQFLRLRRYGFLGDEQLASLYRRCAFALFLSRNEGFGLPLIEALWTGCVPLLSDIEIFAEIMGADYPLFGENAEQELIEFIGRVRGDAGFRARVIEQMEAALDAHADGYHQSAGRLLEFLHESPVPAGSRRRRRA